METLGTPEYRPIPGYYLHPTSTYLGVDARRGFGGIYQEEPRCGPTRTRTCPPGCFFISCAYRLPRGKLSDVADGLSHLHSRNVIHGDLKWVCCRSTSHFTIALTPSQQSVLVDGSGRARITDFGLATVTQRVGSMLSILDEYQLTARWTAPEILNDQGSFSKEADIFSFAMVTIAVRYGPPTARGVVSHCYTTSTQAFTGAVPFNNLPDATAMLAVMDGRRPPRPSHPTFTDELWALTQRCWSVDSRLRPEALDVSRVLRGAWVPISFRQQHFVHLTALSCVVALQTGNG